MELIVRYREHRQLIHTSFGPSKMKSTVSKTLALLIESGIVYWVVCLSSCASGIASSVGMDVEEDEDIFVSSEYAQ